MAEGNPEQLLDDCSVYSVHSMSSHINPQRLEECTAQSIQQHTSVSPASPTRMGTERPVSGMLVQALRGVHKHGNRLDLCGVALRFDPGFKVLSPLIQQSTSQVRLYSAEKMEAFTHCCSIVDLSVDSSKDYVSLGDSGFRVNRFTDFYHYSVHTTVPACRYQLEKEKLKLSESLVSELSNLYNCEENYIQSECERIFKEYGSHVYVGDIHFGGIYSWEACYSGEAKDASVVCQNVEDSVSDMMSTSPHQQSMGSNVTTCALKKKGGPFYAPSFNLWKMGLESNSNSWTLIDRGSEAVGIWEIILNHESEVHNVSHLSEMLFRAWESVASDLPQAHYLDRHSSVLATVERTINVDNQMTRDQDNQETLVKVPYEEQGEETITPCATTETATCTQISSLQDQDHISSRAEGSVEDDHCIKSHTQSDHHHRSPIDNADFKGLPMQGSYDSTGRGIAKPPTDRNTGNARNTITKKVDQQIRHDHENDKVNTEDSGGRVRPLADRNKEQVRNRITKTVDKQAQLDHENDQLNSEERAGWVKPMTARSTERARNTTTQVTDKDVLPSHGNHQENTEDSSITDDDGTKQGHLLEFQLSEKRYKLIEHLKLLKYYPEKISIQDVMQLDNRKSEEKTLIEDVPWNILRGLIMLDQGVITSEFQKCEMGLADYLDDDDDELNPLDIFLATFVCCDLILRQTLIEKMNQCRLAFPFISPSSGCQNLSYNLWSLRSTILDWCNASQTSIEDSCVACPLKVVSCLRLGQPSQSKSVLLNYLMSDNTHGTFVNKDSPNGDRQKIFAEGLVEGSFYLPDGRQVENQGESLDEVTLFLNLRGDGRQHDKQVNVLSKISNVVLVFLDISELESDDILQRTAHIKRNSKDVLIVLSGDPKLPKDEVTKLINSFQNKVGNLHDKKIVQAFSRRRVKNAALLKSEVIKEIKESIQGDQHSTLQDFSQMMIQESIHVDEMDGHCQEGKSLADKVMASFAQSTKGKRKSDLLPLQGANWQEWCRLLKKKKRSRSTNESNTLEAVGRTEAEMQKHRNNQALLSNRTNPFIKTFIKGLTSSLGSSSMDYYILWVKLCLDQISRQELPILKRLKDERSCALKAAKDARNSKTEMLEKEVHDLKLQIVNTEIGLEHLMRELGQLYEASETATYYLAYGETLEKLPHLAATMLLKGHALEIMDGDASGVPLIWLDAVFAELEKILGKQKIFSVSVLGIQSSGKSTLLNTMFGFQFPVSAGRCTKGVYMQLLKVKDFPFDYMAILDSEGLRPPEFTGSKYDHDNELATFLIGLGNMTVINIKGENVVEVKDILQIVCHAFLRMMMVNEGIQKDRSSVFVHQNVPAVNARDKMKDEAERFEEALDDMTVEAASLENMSNIRLFNQVIKFDRQKHIWYFPDLWHGDPPMASVNTGYHRSVVRLKSNILNNQAKESRWYYNFEEMKDFIKDMWNGVLADDFVFGFRSSQVTKAYNQLEHKFSELKWELEVAVNDWMENVQLEEGGTDCTKLKQEAVDHIRNKQAASMLALDSFIENDSQKQIMKSWHEQKRRALDCVAEAQCLNVKNDIDRMREEHEINRLKNKKKHLHKQEILRRAQKLAEEVEETDEQYLSCEFEKLWNEWIGDVSEESAQSNAGTIEQTLAELLYYHLKANNAVLSQDLSDNPLNEIPSLVGSISRQDLNINTLGFKDKSSALTKGQIEQIKKSAITGIDTVFSEVDRYIKQVKEREHSWSEEVFNIENVKEALTMLRKLVETLNDNPDPDFIIDHDLEVYLGLHVSRHFMRYRLIPPALKTNILDFLVQHYPDFDQDYLKENLTQCNLEGSIRDTQIHESEISSRSQDVYASVGRRQFQELKKQAVVKINGIFRKVDSYSEHLTERCSSFRAHDAGEILKTVQDELRKFNSTPDELFTIPKKLEVRLLVHVCRYCLQMFCEIQDQHNKRHSDAGQLQDYKKTMWNLFLNRVKETGRAVTAARMLCDELKPLIKNHVRESIQTAVLKEVVPHFFGKRKLIKVILHDLAEKESFSAYQGYLHDTERFVLNWLLQYTDSFIFNERSGSCWYMDKVKSLLNRLFTMIEKAVAETSQREFSQNNIGHWIAHFSNALSKMPEPITYTSTIPLDIDAYVVENFQTSIAIPVAKGLQQAKEELIGDFHKETHDTTKRGKKTPYPRIYSTLWGCDATCPFCEEPCINPDPRHVSYDTCHECIQHRPRGIMHWKNNRTKELMIENCNYDVQGEREFLCSGTIHECTSTGNPERTYHAFKSYKKYMPLWDIPPSADMSCSNYWKWFFCKYKKEIAEDAVAKEPDLPQSWYNITKGKAIESLFEYGSIDSDLSANSDSLQVYILPPPPPVPPRSY